MYSIQLKHLTFSRTDTLTRTSQRESHRSVTRSLIISWHNKHTRIYIGVYKTPRTEFVVLQHRKQLRDRRRQGRG